MASPDEADRPIIGFVPADTRVVQLPFDVTISTPDIGGPSAGLAFTLSLLDELTKGNLMGDNRVAATGTINELGAVGAIGALVQKAVAVRDAGVTLFLVPRGQSGVEIQKAREAAGKGVEIVQVASLDQALKVLRARGGDPLPASISMDEPLK
jgi:PDZ domain-containing protein